MPSRQVSHPREEQAASASSGAESRSGPPNPFALISHRKDAKYRLIWALSYAILPFAYPIRIIGFLLGLVFLEISARLSVVGLDLSKPVPKWRREVSRGLITFWTSVLCAFAGYGIEERGLENKPNLDRAHIIVSNHVTAMDGILYAALGFPAFIAKEEVKSMPVFGTAVWVNQGLFVKRESKDSRRKCLLAIKQRALENYWYDMDAAALGSARPDGKREGRGKRSANFIISVSGGGGAGGGDASTASGESALVVRETAGGVSAPRGGANGLQSVDPAVDLRGVSPTLYRAGKSRPWPCLFIFPEGTTTNSTALIHFKKGAFTPGLPVCPVITRYDQRFVDVSDCYQNMAQALLRTMMCLKTTVVVEYLPEYVPSAAERADCVLYARNVRNTMAEAMGVPATEFTYEDKRYYTGQEDDYGACSPEFQEAFGQACREKRPPQPARWEL